jgi:hypothetical protein
MNPVTAALACTGLSSLLAAQVVEIPAMTVLHSSVDMDNAGPAGPVTLTAIRNAGSNGGAPIASITLTPSTAANGFYNWNVSEGRGLGRHTTNNSLILVSEVPPTTTPPPPIDPREFGAFDATIDLDTRSNEFGLSVGDWSGGMVVEFRNRVDDSLVATHTTSWFLTAGPKFLQAQSSFDRVKLRADLETGNYVITELHVGTSPPWEPFGAGCPGANGMPLLDAITPPARGSVFTLGVTNMPPTGGVFITALGFSTTNSPTLGPLPIDLAPLGAPGCILLADPAIYEFQLQVNGTGQWSANIPNDAVFAGLFIANQAFVEEAGANAMGMTVTNGGSGNIQ